MMENTKQNGGEKGSEKAERIGRKVRMVISMQDQSTDPQGSYTGIPADRYEKPVQDADDL